MRHRDPSPPLPGPDRRTACPLCGAEDLAPVYERRLAAAALGRRRIQLDSCRSCGLLFQNPRPSASALAGHYRSSIHASGAVWRESGTGSSHGALVEARRTFVAGMLGTARPARLLDVGCGGGELLAAFAGLADARIGLEPNAPAAARARRHGIEVREATLEDNDFVPASFDFVSCVSCLEHVTSVHDSMEALARLVAPGGLLFLEVPDSTRPLAQAAEFYSIEHLTHFTRGTLYRLLAWHGFAPMAFTRPDVPALRVGARLVGKDAAAPVEIPDDRAALDHALARYRDERMRLEHELGGRLHGNVARWCRTSAKVAIYGAGDHTRFLTDLIDFGGCVTTVLDGDPKKRGGTFLGWPVHSPDDLPHLGVDAVVVSSQPFQEEMVARIERSAAAHGIEIVCCYPSRSLA